VKLLLEVPLHPKGFQVSCDRMVWPLDRGISPDAADSQRRAIGTFVPLEVAMMLRDEIDLSTRKIVVKRIHLDFRDRDDASLFPGSDAR